MIDYVTIATTGNAVDFGDLSGVILFKGGFMFIQQQEVLWKVNNPCSPKKFMDTITIRTTGRMQLILVIVYFTDLKMNGGGDNATSGILGRWWISPIIILLNLSQWQQQEMQQDFGDLTQARSMSTSACIIKNSWCFWVDYNPVHQS